MPSGSNASAATRETMPTVATVPPCASAQGSARSEYHVRKRSKLRAKPVVNAMKRPFESNAQLPASAGVMVNETASDASVAVTTTSANSDKKRPTMPGKYAIGKNTTTSTSVM